MNFIRITAVISHLYDQLTILILVFLVYWQRYLTPKSDASLDFERRGWADGQIFHERKLTVKVLQSHFSVLKVSIKLFQVF
jgi:hypothetical protein